MLENKSSSLLVKFLLILKCVCRLVYLDCVSGNKWIETRALDSDALAQLY